MNQDVLRDMAIVTQVSQRANDNLFSADHRTNMMSKYGWTAAREITIEDLTRGKAWLTRALNA